MRLLCAALILIAGTGTAAADISVNTSRYLNGMLTIAGHTEPNQIVVLDGKYKTKSDAEGDFKFTEHYKPAICMSTIDSGSSTYGAVIAGCFDPSIDDEPASLHPKPAKQIATESKK